MNFKIEFEVVVNNKSALKKSGILKRITDFCRIFECELSHRIRHEKSKRYDYDFPYPLVDETDVLQLSVYRTLPTINEYYYHAQMFQAFFQLLSFEDSLCSPMIRLVES